MNMIKPITLMIWTKNNTMNQYFFKRSTFYGFFVVFFIMILLLLIAGYGFFQFSLENYNLKAEIKQYEENITAINIEKERLVSYLDYIEQTDPITLTRLFTEEEASSHEEDKKEKTSSSEQKKVDTTKINVAEVQDTKTTVTTSSNKKEDKIPTETSSVKNEEDPVAIKDTLITNKSQIEEKKEEVQKNSKEEENTHSAGNAKAEYAEIRNSKISQVNTNEVRYSFGLYNMKHLPTIIGDCTFTLIKGNSGKEVSLIKLKPTSFRINNMRHMYAILRASQGIINEDDKVKTDIYIDDKLVYSITVPVNNKNV